MPDPNPEALRFLLTRRSRPAKTLAPPYPTRTDLETLLTAAARTPDHGKLEPWRFLVFSGDAPARLAAETRRLGAAQARSEDAVEKAAQSFAAAGCFVTVVECRRSTEKIPALEQTYSAGAACLALLNAALAAGWGANWLTGWTAHDAAFGAEVLGLDPGERVAGYLHIGTETAAPPERPRPDLTKVVAWIDR